VCDSVWTFQNIIPSSYSHTFQHLAFTSLLSATTSMSTSDMHRPQCRRSLHPTDFQLDLMGDAPVNVTATKTVYQELDAAPPPYDTATSSQHSPTVMPSTGHATDTPLQPLHRQYIGFDARFCSTVPLELEMKQDLSISGGDWIVYSKSSGEAVMRCKGSWGPRNRAGESTIGFPCHHIPHAAVILVAMLLTTI